MAVTRQASGSRCETVFRSTGEDLHLQCMVLLSHRYRKIHTKVYWGFVHEGGNFSWQLLIWNYLTGIICWWYFWEWKGFFLIVGFDSSLLSSGVRANVKWFFSFGKDFYLFKGLVFFYFLMVILYRLNVNLFPTSSPRNKIGKYGKKSQVFCLVFSWFYFSCWLELY